MEAEYQPGSRVFEVQCPKERRESAGYFSHLRPLSSYTRKIMCDDAEAWPSFGQNLPASFCNIKIEIVNSKAPVSAKRRPDDVSLEEGSGTLLRKRLALCSSTADLGSTLDARGGLSGKIQAPKSPVKPLNTPRLTMVRKAVQGANVGRPAPCREPGPVATEGVVSRAASRDKASSDVGMAQTPLPPSLENRPPPQKSAGEPDVDHAFDFDIEEILSLSPIYSGASDDSEGIEAFIESCQSFYENGPAQGVGRGGEVGGDSRKEAVSLDEGYFSRSYHEALRSKGPEVGGVGQPPLVDPWTLQSTPLALGAELQPSSVVKGEALPSPAPTDEPVVCRNLLSFLNDPPPCTKTAGALQGGGKGVWEGAGPFSGQNGKPGGPGVTVKVEADVEKNCPSPFEQSPGFHVDIGEPPKTLFRGTVLPPVQVRSVVVVPQKSAEPDDDQSGLEHIKRPIVYDREADWQREKELYVAAVSSHMKNSSPSGGGAMTELVNLMKVVARQGTKNGNEPWQHPSDFTRRNYQPPSGKAKISLDEWQQRTMRYCRFADVPDQFQRSPVL